VRRWLLSKALPRHHRPDLIVRHETSDTLAALMKEIEERKRGLPNP